MVNNARISHVLQRSSLKLRLIVSALLLILVIMPTIGFTLSNAFMNQAKNAIQNELSAYVYSVLAVADIENQQLYMPEQLLENRFNVIQSGLYALISMPQGASINTVVWQSNSMLGIAPPTDLPMPEIGESNFQEEVVEGDPYLIYSFTASFEQKKKQNGEWMQFPMTIHIIKDQSDFKLQVKQFNHQLWMWLLILMVFLLVVQLAWLIWTLKPLARFSQELVDIEQGQAQQMTARYPLELQAVAQQMNTLLNTEQNQRKRYRNALSDLAHSLKTPLAVIQSQADLNSSSIEQVSVINNIIGHQLKRAQTAAGASWYLGIRVNEVSEKLIRVLTKIYRDSHIEISANVDQASMFKGDQQDLSEILGNLLDNACKAAKKQVLLSVKQANKQLTIVVEDDGEGIRPEQQSQILERGIRADSYQRGHGVGLAIVADLVDSYNGKLAVSDSTSLGGAKFTISFQVG
ncbi:ATP-binding protein [Psychromonas sp. PT13]|uniref:ATP-binding protein n=1 Tax=Psychromonas sp. PT13 TaxID=3439547 RepID=UPI003EC04B1E